MTATRTRRPATIKPVVLDEVRVYRKPIYCCELLPQGHPGWIAINGQEYHLQCLGHGSRDGYRLHKDGSPEWYDLDTSSGRPVCDCPDYVARRGTVEHPYCKHGLALIQLRKAGAL
jgi:hypothetical protein